MKTTNALVLASCILFSLSGCATTSGARGGGTAKAAELVARTQALSNFVTEALKPCEEKGKAEDTGIIVVTARPDGALSIGAMQWQGSEEMKQCISQEAPKARMPAWSGPQVTSLWAISTKGHSPPQIVEPPASYRQRQVEHVQRAQGNSGMGSDASTGPLAACAQRSLPPDSYALVSFRLFIFPDGKVVGATPLSNDGEGKDAGYMDCAAEITLGWTFDAFPGPAYTSLDVPLKYGINPLDR